MEIFPVVLAGGAGTRLWPLSTEEKPKQFHDLSGKGSLLAGTLERLKPLKPGKNVVVTSLRYVEQTRDEMVKAGLDGAVLAEPVPRNTAAAVLYAALYLMKAEGDGLMIVLPADHYIKKPDVFVETLKKGLAEAEKNRLVTIGIKPLYPETGYGYIRGFGGPGEVLEVDSFVEKPDAETARRYLEDGNYYWNSGIFIWKASVIVEWFRKLLPGHVKSFEIPEGSGEAWFLDCEGPHWDEKVRVFSGIQPVSVDYGILEKAGERYVIPADPGWGDLGSWKSVDDVLEPDGMKNRSPRGERCIFVDSRNCSVFPEGSRVALVGVSGLVVVESGGNILVIDKESSQDVRKVVERMRDGMG